MSDLFKRLRRHIRWLTAMKADELIQEICGDV